MPRPFLRFARCAAVVACAASTLFVQPASAQAHLYQVDSGSNGGICLSLHEASLTPIRVTGYCNDQSCGGTTFRFEDLTSDRGLLQVVSTGYDGTLCTRLDGSAAWGGTHVVLTGPPGATSVVTRMRYQVSTAGSDSTPGWPTFSFGARLRDLWFEPVPANATDFELVSPFKDLGLNQAWSCNAAITTSALTGSTCFLLHLPLNEPVFDLPPGYTANSPELGIVDNIWHGLDVEGDWNAATGNVACFSSMPLIHSVTGNLVAANTSTEDVDFSGLETVGGDISVDNNDEAEDIDFSGLETVGGDISVTGNGTSGSSLARSGLPSTINLASLATVNGDANISANAAGATVALGPLTVVNGDLTLETLVTGALDLSAAAIFGNIDIETRGADSVAVATPAIAGATTAIAITRDHSSIAVHLPADTFVGSEALSVAHLDSGSWTLVRALDAAGKPVKLARLAAYAMDVAGNPALQQDATLSMELNVAALPATLQAAVLGGLTDNRVVLTHRGDAAPHELYQALAICPPSTPPAVDGCAALALLDADHNPLPPGSLDLPSFVRFTALTDHFSELAIALEVEPGHIREMGPPLPLGIVALPSTASRNGSNVNLPALVETSPAIIGREWRAEIDLPGVGPKALFLSMGGPAEGIFVPSGEVLLQPPVLLLPNRGFSLPIPRATRLVGLTFSTQSAVFMEGGWRLTNALDVTIRGSQ